MRRYSRLNCDGLSEPTEWPTAAHRAALDEVSAPQLNFPAENNRLLAPHLQFAGATVDGRSSTMLPMFASGTRY